MFQNAYALFFLSVLIGSVIALHALIRAHAAEMFAVLQGAPPRLIEIPARPRYARFRSGGRPAFPPVQLSICRL
jgi:hypothetical protein